jgi:polar amino acid transport system substrate-binding protein
METFPMNNAFRLPILSLASMLLLASCSRPDGGKREPSALPELGGRLLTAALASVPAKSGVPAADSWERKLVEEMAKRLGARLTWKQAASGDSLGALKSGRLALAVGGITRTQALEAGLECSDVYLRSELFLLARSDEARFCDAASFAADPGLRLGVLGDARTMGAAASLIASGPGDARLEEFDSSDAAVEALLSGGVDALPMDAQAIRSYLGARPGALKAIGRPVESREYVIAFGPGSGLAPAFDAALSALASEGFQGAEEARLAASPK